MRRFLRVLILGPLIVVYAVPCALLVGYLMDDMKEAIEDIKSYFGTIWYGNKYYEIQRHLELTATQKPGSQKP